MSLLLHFPDGHEHDHGRSDFAGLHRMAAAEFRHALPDCGCFGGPDGRRAHQLVQLGAGAGLFAFHEAFELARAPSLTQFLERLRLDLANPFARHGE